MQLWLIRTAENIIAGPYSKEVVQGMVRDGKLNPEDEICSAGGYWFLLSDTDEVFHQLEIEMPRKSEHEEEETQTDTKIIKSKDDGLEEDFPIPDLPALEDFTDQEKRATTAAAAIEKAREQSKPMEVYGEGFGKMEPTGIWKILAILMLILALGLAFSILKGIWSY